jgi:hypothetical protein
VLKDLKEQLRETDIKGLSKVGVSLAAGTVAYAVGHESIKVGLRAAPGTGDIEWMYDNTDPGLVIQTALLIASTRFSANFLKKNTNFLGDGETKEGKLAATKYARIAQNAGVGLALGRLMTGLSTFDFGKRFESVLDGKIADAVSPAPGPAWSTPQNAKGIQNVLTLSNEGWQVNRSAINQAVARGAPYRNGGSNTDVYLARKGQAVSDGFSISNSPYA